VALQRLPDRLPGPDEDDPAAASTGGARPGNEDHSTCLAEEGFIERGNTPVLWRRIDPISVHLDPANLCKPHPPIEPVDAFRELEPIEENGGSAVGAATNEWLADLVGADDPKSADPEEGVGQIRRCPAHDLVTGQKLAEAPTTPPRELTVGACRSAACGT